VFSEQEKLKASEVTNPNIIWLGDP